MGKIIALIIVTVGLLTSPAVAKNKPHPALKAGVPLTVHLQTGSACPGGALHCATLSWTPPTGTPAAVSFNIYRTATTGGCSTVTAAGCTKVNPVAITSNSFVDSTLAATTTYFWVATSVGSNNAESGPSNQVTATTPADPAPAPPTGLSVTAVQ